MTMTTPTVEHVQPNADQLARVSNLVRSLYKQQRIPYPDAGTIKANRWRYPFDRDDIARAYLMDRITCPKCGGRCEYYKGTATCINMYCGEQYPW